MGIRRVLAFAAMAAVIVTACSGPPGSGNGTPTATQVVQPSGTTTVARSPGPLTASPSVDTAPPEPSLEPPPVAMLRVGQRSYPGKIGGYTWKAHGDSAPWLPARALDPVTITAGARLSVKLEGVAIAQWTARIARAADTSGENVTGLGHGRRTISFEGPRSGSWVLSVVVEYADELGSGAYYWRLDVR
jgi:hypothetical protein